MQKKTERTLFITLAILFGLYVLIRAWWLPITHDEGATCFNHVPRRLLDTLFFQKEANPNNHILNTLGIKILEGIFGWHPLVIRLPALIGGSCYLAASFYFAKRLSETGWLRVLSLLLLLGNPYMVEFFGLARGYGLALGLMALALWQTWRFLDTGLRKYFSRGVLWAGLAVYANFTLLIFYAPFLCLIFYAAWIQHPTRKTFWAVTGKGVKITGVLLALMATPLIRLSQDNEIIIWNRLPSFMSTVQQLVQSAIRNKPYFGPDTVQILSVLLVTGVVAGWVWTAVRWWQQRHRQPLRDPGIFTGFLLLGTVVTNFAQVWATHTPFLQARLSLFYYPLAALLLAWMAAWLHQRSRIAAVVYGTLLAAFVLFNHGRCLNFINSYEWWYDSGTVQALDYLHQLHEKEKPPAPYTLDVHWGAQNSFGVHTQLLDPVYQERIRLAPWHPNQPPRRESEYEFYYAISPDEVKDILDVYDIVYRVPASSFLLLRKRK
jgi:hypothetical protein